MDYVKLILLGLVTLIAAMAASWGHDLAYQVHAFLIMVIAFAMFIWVLRNTDEPRQAGPAQDGIYADGVIRAGVIATAFWGIAGFLVGTFIAFQLAFPVLNFEWAQPYANFGRLRPLHTSAVIFAFGGNALIATSFYVVQRTSGVRLWGGRTGWFVFWGYQLFIVLAATGYLLGATQSKEYAEPEWYVDLWLTVVWLAYLAVFLGTIIKRREPHILVALYRLDHRPRALRGAGLERDDHLCLPLLPHAEALGPQADVFHVRNQLALLARHAWYRSLRRVDVGDRHHGRPDVARSG